MVAHVRYSVAGQSSGRVAPCAVYTVHVEMRSVGFLVEPQNQGRRFVSGLASKPLRWFSLVWPQNQCRRFLRFGLKTDGDSFLVEPQNEGGGGFPDLGLKITATVSWFGPQNQAGFGLLVEPQNRWEDATAWDTRRDLAACFTWKQV
jgi:hypothetical protein